MPMLGYESNEFVRQGYRALKQMISEMAEGELVDLIGRFQTVGFKEDKAREYVFAAISSGWIEISEGKRSISTLDAKKNLKYLKSVHFRSLLLRGGEARPTTAMSFMESLADKETAKKRIMELGEKQ